MTEMFVKIMQWIFEIEGGFSDDPADAGGRTNYGITQRTLNAYRMGKGLPTYDVKDLKKPEALEIYEAIYWSPSWEALGFPLASCMMDTAVNSGPAKAKMLLQGCDGDYVKYLQLRSTNYDMIVQKNPTQQRFIKGWKNRLVMLRRFIDENRDVPV